MEYGEPTFRIDVDPSDAPEVSVERIDEAECPSARLVVDRLKAEFLSADGSFVH